MAPPLGASSRLQQQQQQHHHLVPHQQHQPRQHSHQTMTTTMDMVDNEQEQRANARIDHAETRVDGLLQELEDLRFLEELEQTKATAAVLPQQSHQRSQSVPRHLSSSAKNNNNAKHGNSAAAARPSSTLRHSHGGGGGHYSNHQPPPQQQQNHPDSSYLKTPRGDTIPAVIRAMSPPPNRRLPPPERAGTLVPPSQSHRSGSPSPAASTHQYHNNATSGRSQSVQRSSEPMPQQSRSQSVQRPPMMIARPPSRTRQSLQQQNPPPLSSASPMEVELEVPLPVEEFPPPPPDPAQDEPLPTPRQVSKMERMDLELAVQTLARRVEIVTQRKSAVEQELRVYQLSHHDHGTTVAQLERTVFDIRAELETSRNEWRSVRQQLLDERDALINAAVQRTKHHDAAEIAELESQVAQVSDLADELQGKLVVSSTLAKTLEQELAKERQERQNLETTHRQERLQLEDNVKALEVRLAAAQRQARDEYELKLSTLEEEVKLRSQDQQAVSTDLTDCKSKLAAATARHQQLEQQKAEQDDLLQEMTDRLDKVHEEYREKFTELKGAYERKDKRRANEAQLAKDDHTNRLAALRQQLVDETTAYETQMKTSVQEALERQRTELTTQHAAQLAALQSEYQQEMARWRETSDRLESELAERDEKLAHLRREWSDRERSQEAQVQLLKQTHQQELQQREESSMRSLRSTESTAKTEFAKKERAYLDQQNLLERKMADLSRTLDDVREQAQEAHKLHKATESELRVQLSILQGKITATDATAQERRTTISTLQDQLDETTKLVKDTEERVQDLTAQLQCAAFELASEREHHTTKVKELQERVEEKTSAAVNFQRQLSDITLRERSAMERVEDREAACQKAQSDLIQERARHANIEEELRSDLAVLQGRLKANETSLSEKRATIEELQDQLQSIADESSTTTRELHRQLERIREESTVVKTQLDTARADLFAKEGIVKQKEKKISESNRIILALEAKMAKHTEGELNVNQTIKDLKSSLDQTKMELQSERIRFKSSEESLNAQVEDLTDKVEQYQSESRKQSEENCRLKESLTQAKDESRELATSHHDQVRALQDELEQIKSQLIEERQTVLAKDDEIHRLDEELQKTTTVVTRSFDTSRQTEEQLQRQVSALQAEVRELQGLLDTQQRQAESSVLTLEKKAAELESQLLESRSSLDDKENVVKDLTTKLEGTSNELQSHDHLHRKALQSANTQLSQVEKQLAQQRAVTEAKEESIKSLQEENRILVDKTIRLADVEGKVAALEEEVCRVNEQKRSQLAEIVRLQGLRDNLPSTAELDQFRREIESERQAKQQVENQLSAVQAELLLEHQRITQLQSELAVIKGERDELTLLLKQVEEKLGKAENESATRALALSASDENRITIEGLRSEVDALTRENESAKGELRKIVGTLDSERRDVKNQLDAAKRQSDDLNLQLSTITIGHEEELEQKIVQFNKEKASLVARISELEHDSEEREKDMKEASDRYSDSLVELKVKVGQLTHDKKTLKNSLAQARSDLDAREERLSTTSAQMASAMSDLQSKLDAQIANNEDLQRSISVLREKAVDIEMIKSKLEIESRDNRSLKNKNRDNEAELQRKETQLEDVVAKYSKEIAELNAQLEDERATQSRTSNEELSRMEKTLVTQQATNERLQREIEVLRSQANAVDFESLNKDLRRLSESNERLQAKLLDVEREKSSLVSDSANAEDVARTSMKDLKDKLKKATAERAEVVNALEEVLNEVQEREDEIDALEEVLHKRDEELEHAKLIAAKALASAQEIKARYKGRGNDRSDLSPKIAELEATVEKLQKENEKLRRHTTKLLKDLEARNPDIRDDRRTSNSGQRLGKFMDQQSNNNGDGFASFDDEGFPAFPACSPTQADSLAFNDTMSTQSGQIRAGSSWLHEFETKSADSEDRSTSTRTEPDSRSSKPKSRDAMQNFYRNRYMKSKV